MKYHDVMKDGPVTITHDGRRVAVLKDFYNDPDGGIQRVALTLTGGGEGTLDGENHDQLNPGEYVFLVHPDKYDREIRELTEKPGLIRGHWMSASPLFQFLSPSGDQEYDDEIRVGCPTMVKNNRRAAGTPELTELVRNDTIIPDDPADINPGHLGRFAEIQRTADAVLDRP